MRDAHRGEQPRAAWWRGLRRRFAGKKCRPRDVFDQLSGINAIRYYLTIGE